MASTKEDKNDNDGNRKRRRLDDDNVEESLLVAVLKTTLLFSYLSVQELATACQNDLTLTVIAVNNARLGTIRAHQERNFPGRVSATELTNPDFCALARSFGATAVRADSTAEFRQSLARARARGGEILT